MLGIIDFRVLANINNTITNKSEGLIPQVRPYEFRIFMRFQDGIYRSNY